MRCDVCLLLCSLPACQLTRSYAVRFLVPQMESQKRYEFLESMVTAVDAHLRFFERGYQLFAGVEPYLQHALQASCFSCFGAGNVQSQPDQAGL